MPSPLQIYKKAASRVPAYKKLLNRSGIKNGSITSMCEFAKLPVIDKNSYIYSHSLNDLFVDGKFPAMIYASSGSSGKPTFWFRGDAQEEHSGTIHAKIFSKIFKIKKQDPTLVIVCFSMGVWVAGNLTLAACRYMSRQGYHIATITPGLEKEDIMNTLKNLAPKFKNVILAGYPPFLMDVVVEAKARGIKFSENAKMFTAGDSFSEEWRGAVLNLVNAKDYYGSIVNIYGSADAGVLGHETPLSVFIRKVASQNKGLAQELFGAQTNGIPGLVQYDPSDIYFEEYKGELIFTANTAVPLVRYNIHDLGKIISFQDMLAFLKKYGLEKQAKNHGLNEWKLPFIIKTGRSDVAVTFYALNIYPENIRAITEDKRVAKAISGNFIAFNKYAKDNKTQKLFLEFELAEGKKHNQKLVQELKKISAEILSKLNIEYRKLRDAIGSRAVPEVVLVEKGSAKFRAGNGSIVNIKGKKPKVFYEQ